jgi:hypothetical protein
MKLPTLALLVATAVGLAQASYLPGLVIQEDVGTYMGDSTNLIKNCGDEKDLLT